MAKQVISSCVSTGELSGTAAKQQIPTPKFNGNRVLTQLITQYNDVSLLNGWEGEGKLLRFKSVTNCGVCTGYEKSHNGDFIPCAINQRTAKSRILSNRQLELV